MKKRQAEKIVTRIHCEKTRRKYVYGRGMKPWYFFIREMYDENQIRNAYKTKKGKQIIERCNRAWKELEDNCW